MNEARTQLGVSLRTILERDRGNELNRLLLEMCEADQLERCVHDEIRSWQPTSDNDFASRWYAIEDETRAAIAKLFFDGLLVFSVEAGTPLDVRWVCRVAEGVS